VGKHIETLPPNANVAAYKLKQANRTKYIHLLAQALDDKAGLYAQAPTNDVLGSGFFEATLPCLCFTELSIHQLADHCREYRRMGFGFTKQFIARNGGGPVHYTTGTEKNPTVKYLKKLKSLLEEPPLRAEELAALDYVMHFFKRLRQTKSPPEHKKTEGDKKPRQQTAYKYDNNNLQTRLARYPRLQDLEYLEENGLHSRIDG
jgi:hypothetical protein